MKHQGLLTAGSDKTQTCNFCFTFRSRKTLVKSSQASACQEERNFEILKRGYMQIYPTSFLLYYGKAVYLQHM